MNPVFLEAADPCVPAQPRPNTPHEDKDGSLHENPLAKRWIQPLRQQNPDPAAWLAGQFLLLRTSGPQCPEKIMSGDAPTVPDCELTLSLRPQRR